jgi:hypothetical protein
MYLARVVYKLLSWFRFDGIIGHLEMDSTVTPILPFFAVEEISPSLAWNKRLFEGFSSNSLKQLPAHSKNRKRYYETDRR